MPVDPDSLAYNMRGLAAAVILQALQDAQAGNHQARRWLQTDGLLWLEALGFRTNKQDLTDYLAKRCPAWKMSENVR